ncbi:MAG TPA: BACON domain-containing carbohydrate-binding protein, partial [Prolixibacteraceae bacterium]|nr:BACON domain-containing carbohydrate-binding protein [Prolixibacteraceae bacterium]
GSGNSEVMVIAEANSTTSQRTGTLVVSATGAGTQTVTVTQAAGAATLTVSPLTIDIAAMGGDTTITITSNTSWTVTSDQSWLSVTPVSGSGNGTVTLTATKNSTANERNATITISAEGAVSHTVVISQAGTVGVLDDELAKIRVYPNPFSEGFYVETGNREATVSLFDLSGRMVLSEKITGTGYIETHTLGKGGYFFEIKTSSTMIEKKIVKR